MGFCVFLAGMILLEPVGLDSRKVIMSFARWRHFITAGRCNWCYPRAVLSLKQGLAISFMFLVVWCFVQWLPVERLVFEINVLAYVRCGLLNSDCSLAQSGLISNISTCCRSVGEQVVQLLSICCGRVLQLAVQQIHNKSKQVEFARH